MENEVDDSRSVGVKAQMENEKAAPAAFLQDLVENRKIPIQTPKCQIGRGEINDIILGSDSSISRIHFLITYENGQYHVEDAKSSHGTYLNGAQVDGPEPLKDGDVLKIGESLFWFVIDHD